MAPPPWRVLLVDDELPLLRAYGRLLTAAGYDVREAWDGERAMELVAERSFDVVVSDISMPGMSGIDLLRRVRARDLDVPVILITASPAVDTAIAAVELGALRYLTKPTEPGQLEEVVGKAVRLHQLARLKRQALAHLGADGAQAGDRAGLEAAFARALDSVWIAFQPIVSWSGRRVHAYEALVRAREAAFPHPGALLSAAERLGRLDDLGRAIRARAGAAAAGLPEGCLLFVNLHPRDLCDAALYAPDAALSRVADRVVLELTERASLEDVDDVRGRVARLRALGFRIAVDDLGAGYAGLTAFAQLEPEVVKIDMSLVRGVDAAPTKRKLIQSLAALCKEMGMGVVAEGVETREERDALVGLGCDLLQGYLFARPGAGFETVTW